MGSFLGGNINQIQPQIICNLNLIKLITTFILETISISLASSKGHYNDQCLLVPICQVHPSLVYGSPTIYEKIYHRLVNMRQDSSGVEKFLIDWSSMQIREKHGECVTPEPERKIGNIPQTIAKNTVCKKVKVKTFVITFYSNICLLLGISWLPFQNNVLLPRRISSL